MLERTPLGTADAAFERTATRSRLGGLIRRPLDIKVCLEPGVTSFGLLVRFLALLLPLDTAHLLIINLEGFLVSSIHGGSNWILVWGIFKWHLKGDPPSLSLEFPVSLV